MTLESSFGVALVVGALVLAGAGLILLLFPRRLTRADIETDEWMGDRM